MEKPESMDKTGKDRNMGPELLRIIAMLMIITLHYLDKGGVLPKNPAAMVEGRGAIAWLIEAFCVPSVNAYVLISAYYFIDREYEPGRVIKLWLRVMLCSVMIPVSYLVLTALRGTQPLLLWDKYDIIRFVMPVTQEHYWFITSYILMMLIAPLMNKKLMEVSETVYRRGLIILLLILSVAPTILPLNLPLDKQGYDGLWFICLYMVGGYLRLYTKKTDGTGKPLLLYVLCCIIIFVSMFSLAYINIRTGKLEDFITRQYHYNSLCNLAAAIFLFRAFTALDIEKERLKGIIASLAGASLTVYLIHEHGLLRYLWPKLFGVSKAWEGQGFIPHWLLTISCIYIICFIIDTLISKVIRRGQTLMERGTDPDGKGDRP